MGPRRQQEQQSKVELLPASNLASSAISVCFQPAPGARQEGAPGFKGRRVSVGDRLFRAAVKQLMNLSIFLLLASKRRQRGRQIRSAETPCAPLRWDHVSRTTGAPLVPLAKNVCGSVEKFYHRP